MSQPQDRPNLGSSYRTPGWVKVFGIIALIVVLLLVVGMLTGRLGPAGGHGPQLHMPSSNVNETAGDADNPIMPTEQVEQQP